MEFLFHFLVFILQFDLLYIELNIKRLNLYIFISCISLIIRISNIMIIKFFFMIAIKIND